VLGGMSSMLGVWLAAAGAAIAGIMALWNSGVFRGGEEGVQVNPARDQFLAQFGPGGTGEGSGFWNLGLQLEDAVGFAQAQALHQALQQAQSMAAFNAAVANINNALSGGGGYTAPTYSSGTSGGYSAPADFSMEAPEEDMGVLERMARGMAKGGFGTVDKPTLFVAGEAGPERYWFSGAKNEQPMPGGQNVTIQAHFHGPVFAEEEYIQTTIVDNILEAFRKNKNSAFTRAHASLGIG